MSDYDIRTLLLFRKSWIHMRELMNRAVCLIALLLVFATSAFADGRRPLLPRPQKIQYGKGRLALSSLAIRFASNPGVEDRFSAQELSRFLSARTGGRIPVADTGTVGKAIVLNRTGAADPLPGPSEKPGPDCREAYVLRVDPQGVEVRAKSSAGIFYGIQTLCQLVDGEKDKSFLPEVDIQDWPSLSYRGVMMDLSHGPMPTEEEIKRQIDFLASWKGNQYYFYSEATIEFKGYPLINPGGRYTQEQVRRIIDYGRLRHVDVVPCMEFYGHLHDVFRLERYSRMSALPYGGEIDPRREDVRAMLKDWVTQMAALFPSHWFHIGFDEPWELELAGNDGSGADPKKLYAEILGEVAGTLQQRGKQVLFWADLNSGAELFNRYPDLLSLLPKNIIAVPWYYDADLDFNRMVELFAKTNIPQVIGTGIWGWDELTPDFAVTFDNVNGFLDAGRKHGIIGMLATNWADSAQILYRMTMPGIACSAVAAWQPEPVERDSFFADYAAVLYPPGAATDAAAALRALTTAQRKLMAALGRETAFRFWDDPLAPAVLDRAGKHRDELHDCRLLAEEAQERLDRALEAAPNSAGLSSLRLAARMLDYAGMKYIYATDVASFFPKMGEHPTLQEVELYLGRQASSRNHSRFSDLMDTISSMREDYRLAWESEYTSYRKQSALGRWDAEYEYWRRLQARFWEFIAQFKDHDPLPSLQSFRPR
jgi:hexosaminidase